MCRGCFGQLLLREEFHSNGIAGLLGRAAGMPTRRAFMAFSVAAASALPMVGAAPAFAADDGADLILRGGTIRRLSGAPVASALAIKDGKVLAVGDESALSGLKRGAKVVDLGGRTMLSGLIDPHLHMPDMPLRGSSMRSLGGYLNVLAIESVMDDLARDSGQDPVAFRLRHLDDHRARTVIETAAARFNWGARPRPKPGIGYGFAFARYKNLEGWCAVAVEIAVERETGRVSVRRVVAAVDTGQVVNPDGVRNQVEGGVMQAMSWTLFERVTFDRARVTSVDWSAYPILRFASAPDSVDVHIVDRPDDRFLGVAEAAQGPSGAALANAIRDATGQRLHDLPFTAARIKEATGV